MFNFKHSLNIKRINADEISYYEIPSSSLRGVAGTGLYTIYYRLSPKYGVKTPRRWRINQSWEYYEMYSETTSDPIDTCLLDIFGYYKLKRLKRLKKLRVLNYANIYSLATIVYSDRVVPAYIVENIINDNERIYYCDIDGVQQEVVRYLWDDHDGNIFINSSKQGPIVIDYNSVNMSPHELRNSRTAKSIRSALERVVEHSSKTNKR